MLKTKSSDFFSCLRHELCFVFFLGDTQKRSVNFVSILAWKGLHWVLAMSKFHIHRIAGRIEIHRTQLSARCIGVAFNLTICKMNYMLFIIRYAMSSDWAAACLLGGNSGGT